MENNKKGKVLRFLKRYGYYALAFVLVFGITLAIVMSSSTNQIEPEVTNQSQVQETETKPLVFSLPVKSPTVLKWYNDSELLYNETLKQWESHMAIDLTSENTNVCSVLDGVVTNVESSYEYGTTITITHKDGFVSKYSSLGDNPYVTISDRVKAGQIIGKMSQSATNESLSGAHLHFELLKDGQKVDPANYLTLENK